MMTELEGGIGALSEHLREMFESCGGELIYRIKVEQILVDNNKVTGVRCRDGETITVVSNLSPDTTLTELVGLDHLSTQLIERRQGRDHRASFVQMHFALDGLPVFAPPYDLTSPACNRPSASSAHPKSNNGNGRTPAAAPGVRVQSPHPSGSDRA
jgi:phytoene dehydrogenase-like protein